MEIIAVGLGLFVAWRILSAINRSLSPRVRAVALILVGFISLIGILPLLGVVATAYGMWLLYRSYAGAADEGLMSSV